MDLQGIQESLRLAGVDGWLFYDFRGSDPLSASILGLDPGRHTTRRWFYLVPTEGVPIKLVHAIEPAVLDRPPGERRIYSGWKDLHQKLKELFAGRSSLAMQYSPNNMIPYVSRVDAGTIELVRSLGVRVVSSGDLVQKFEATLTPEQLASHQQSADILGKLVRTAFDQIALDLRRGRSPTEAEVQRSLLAGMESAGMTTDHPPNVSVGPNSADPHYAPSDPGSLPIGRDEVVLIDIWGKALHPGSVYADITWMGFTGDAIPAEVEKVFRTVVRARDAGVALIRERLAQGADLRGCDVDDVCRQVIAIEGFGEFFTHRTGHSIQESTHGNGANLDNFETHDERKLLPRTLFSIEPGIYLPGRFGVRSEINVYLTETGEAMVTGPEPQQELVRIV